MDTTLILLRSAHDAMQAGNYGLAYENLRYALREANKHPNIINRGRKPSILVALAALRRRFKRDVLLSDNI